MPPSESQSTIFLLSVYSISSAAMVLHPGSPVKIRVSTDGFQGVNLTSPTSVGRSGRSAARRTSGAAVKTLDEAEETPTKYTVHIPHTPDHPLSTSPSLPGRSFVSGTVFTGGFNSVTRGHVMDRRSTKSTDEKNPMCKMNGCDDSISDILPCECGFPICKDCYRECGGAAGRCPGCKEPYKDNSSEEEENPQKDDRRYHDHVLPLASMADCRLMRSTNFDFDYSRWISESKGTYGYGNAVWPKTGFPDDPPDFSENTRRPLTRKIPVSAAIISPYR